MGGSENDNLVQIFYFAWYFIDFSAVMYLFEVKESTLKSFVKIGPSMLKKMAVLCQTKARGRFCCHAHILIYFCFFNASYKITPVPKLSNFRTLLLKCTGNESALTPVHFNDDVLFNTKLAAMVKRFGLKSSNFLSGYYQ